MSVTLTWSSFWPYFNLASNETKVDLIKQIDLPRFLRGLDAEHQTEVLETAPLELVKELKNILYLQTTIDLGLVKPAMDLNKMSKKAKRLLMG